MKKTAIILGDSFPNTLGLLRSLGQANIPLFLILVADDDWSRVLKCKYINKDNHIKISDVEESLSVLKKLSMEDIEGSIFCTNDRAAEFIDSHEEELSALFRTPLRGKHIGKYFNKAEQCELAGECGLDVPKSIVYKRSMDINSLSLKYPLLTKPLVSTGGQKEDIHICLSKNDLIGSLQEKSSCEEFIIQEYIDKEFELDCLGVRSEKGVIWGGAVRKIRHWPPNTGAGSYAKIYDMEEYGVKTKEVESFLAKVGYYGLFSVEFIHKDGKNYFMEVNFRNDGLGYVATVAGLNLPAHYMYPENPIYIKSFHPIYMMNTSSEKRYIKKGMLSFFTWLKDYWGTECFIDYDKHDLSPLIWQYIDKVSRLKNKIKSKF